MNKMIDMMKELVEWQPMDTAPKDGTDVLILCSRNDIVCVGSYFCQEGHEDEDDPENGKAWWAWIEAMKGFGCLAPIGWRSIQSQ